MNGLQGNRFPGDSVESAQCVKAHAFGNTFIVGHACTFSAELTSVADDTVVPAIMLHLETMDMEGKTHNHVFPLVMNIAQLLSLDLVASCSQAANKFIAGLQGVEITPDEIGYASESAFAEHLQANGMSGPPNDQL